MTVSAELEAEIHRLSAAEHWPPGTIARQLAIHIDVVHRVLGLQAPRQHVRKPSFVDEYVPFMRETLGRWPTLRSTRLFDMLKERGFPGSPRTVREHVARLRPRREREAFLRTIPLIGEQSQVDWAFVQNVNVDGAKRQLWMFVIVLSWSRAMWCELCFTMDAATVARSLVRAAKAFDGVTRQWLFDNPKTIVIERVGDAVRFHPLLLSTTTALRVQPQLCAPRRANEKGKVERAIRFVRERALVDFVFHNIDEGNERLQRFCTGVALDRPHPTLPGRTVRECLDEERPRLLRLVEPLPPTDEQRSVVVDKTAFVRFDTNDYSVPHTLVGKTLSLFACDRQVRLVDVATPVAVHKRCFGRRQSVENPEHRQALVEVKRRARDGVRRDQLSSSVPAFRVVLERWLEEGRNVGVAVARASSAFDDYGADVFGAAVDEFVARGLVDPAALTALCDHILRTRKPRPSPAPAPHHVDDRDVTPHDLGGYDDPED
ncbi:MAG: IS21 family transposase [bacterium]